MITVKKNFLSPLVPFSSLRNGDTFVCHEGQLYICMVRDTEPDFRSGEFVLHAYCLDDQEFTEFYDMHELVAPVDINIEVLSD